MTQITINEALNDFQKLSDSDKEYFLEVAKKQMIEVKRKQLADRVSEAEKNYAEDKSKSGNVDNLLWALESD
jgi:GH43 family beta-xylosidase